MGEFITRLTATNPFNSKCQSYVHPTNNAQKQMEDYFSEYMNVHESSMTDVEGKGNFIYVSIYIQVLDTPTHGHSLWHDQ